MGRKPHIPKAAQLEILSLQKQCEKKDELIENLMGANDADQKRFEDLADVLKARNAVIAENCSILRGENNRLRAMLLGGK